MLSHIGLFGGKLPLLVKKLMAAPKVNKKLEISQEKVS